MLRTARSIEGFEVSGLDGRIGKVHDLWFDGESWTVPSLIVRTQGWLLGRKVEVGSECVEEIDDEARAVRLDMTRDEVDGLPEAGLAAALAQTLRLPEGLSLCWLPGAAFAGAAVSVPPDVAPSGEAGPIRSWRAVSGWTVQASDGRVGDVEDLIIDDHDWTVHALSVDTGRFWRGRTVLVPLRMAERLHGHEERIDLVVPRETVWASLGAGP